MFDLAGNVAEWCQDAYGDYPGGSASDPAGATAGLTRVARGGSGLTPLAFCRAAARDSRSEAPAPCRDAWLGFRVALAPQYAQPEPAVSPVAQGGAITGTVTLVPGGAPLPGVTVMLVNTNYPVDTNDLQNNRGALAAQAVTGADGRYTFSPVKPGNYGVAPVKLQPGLAWQFTPDGQSDPPLLALSNETRTVNFTTPDPTLWDVGQFTVTIWVTGLTGGSDASWLSMDRARQYWVLFVPLFGDAENIAMDPAGLQTFQPWNCEEYNAAIKYDFGASYGYYAFLGGLANTFR